MKFKWTKIKQDSFDEIKCLWIHLESAKDIYM